MGGETNLRTVTGKPVKATASTLQLRGCSPTMLFTSLYGPPPHVRIHILFEGVACSPAGAVVHLRVGRRVGRQWVEGPDSRERVGRQLHRLEVPRLENATGETLGPGICTHGAPTDLLFDLD